MCIYDSFTFDKQVLRFIETRCQIVLSFLKLAISHCTDLSTDVIRTLTAVVLPAVDITHP